jgi:hypothetical protein
MATQRAFSDPVAWLLTKERIGQDLRKHYPAPQDFPAELLTLVRKLAIGESVQQTPSTWLRRLDAVEGHHLLRGCRKRLGGAQSSSGGSHKAGRSR